MVIDCVTFNGERELFDLRYNILKDYVDEFIVIEFDKTFAGENREITEESAMFFWQYDKVTHVIHREEDYEKYREMAQLSPNTTGADHWKREFMQKESIKDALTLLQDNDTVFIGDVDEIYDETSVETAKFLFRLVPETSIKLRLRVYTYYLNNRSTEIFWGTLVSKYVHVKKNCLNHMRSNATGQNSIETGWHFTSMGGTESVKKKLTDSYTQESYATPAVLDNLEYNMAENKDFLGRNFTYTTDETEWPQYLKDNREKYINLIK